MNSLQDIRRQERSYYRDGREADSLMARLDDLNAQIRYDRRE